MTHHVVVLLIMDMEPAKSDVNGPKKKLVFLLLRILLERDKKHQKITLKRIDPNCIELNMSFKIFKYGFLPH